MAWGDRKPEGNEKAQLPSGFLPPQAVSAGPVNITVQEDEFRVAIFGRVVSFAPVGRKIERPTPARYLLAP